MTIHSSDVGDWTCDTCGEYGRHKVTCRPEVLGLCGRCRKPIDDHKRDGEKLMCKVTA